MCFAHSSLRSAVSLRSSTRAAASRSALTVTPSYQASRHWLLVARMCVACPALCCCCTGVYVTRVALAGRSQAPGCLHQCREPEGTRRTSCTLLVTTLSINTVVRRRWQGLAPFQLRSTASSSSSTSCASRSLNTPKRSVKHNPKPHEHQTQHRRLMPSPRAPEACMLCCKCCWDGVVGFRTPDRVVDFGTLHNSNHCSASGTFGYDSRIYLITLPAQLRKQRWRGATHALAMRQARRAALGWW